MEICEACAIAKARQKNTTQDSQGHGKSTIYNKKVYSDLSYIYGPNQKRAYKYVWHLMIDSATGLGTDGFYKAKISFIEPACQQLQKWKTEGKEVKILRQDNAGENKLFEERAASADWKLATKFENTARETPQHNGLVEVGFATQAQLAKAMFNDANFDSEMRLKLAKECLSLANKNCNLAVIEFNNQQLTRYEAAGQEISKWTKNLRSFGEAGVVKISKDGKFGDCRITCIFVNYEDKHSSNCYRMYNPKSGKIIETRDIQWLNKMYFQNDPIRSEFFKI